MNSPLPRINVGLGPGTFSSWRVFKNLWYDLATVHAMNRMNNHSKKAISIVNFDSGRTVPVFVWGYAHRTFFMTIIGEVETEIHLETVESH